MTCPHCQEPLRMAERQGIEIDYCARCRGIWLDRGELDKILERSGYAGNRPHASDDFPRPLGADGFGGRVKHKKRKSLLGELFDVFD